MDQSPALLTLRVRRIGWEADGVVSLDLAAPDGRELPPFGPGAHIDVHLADVIRQYSLCGDPADRRHYRVAVREVPGGRVSRAIHREMRHGAMVTVGVPRNNFPLVAAERYLFIAGGIGITPLLPMMREAQRNGADWSLLFCTTRLETAPFLDEVRALGGAVSLHVSEAGTRLDVAARLGSVGDGVQLYCCGPDRLMTAVEAATQSWPAENVHFEWFSPRAREDDGAAGTFEVVCAQSGISVAVAPGQSVLEALTAACVEVPRSCEQGICGTCECRVLEGEVDHRDSILSAAERAANQSMMTCVSRAKGTRLVLDV